jgi:putative FmdB family regulatory protein
MPIYEFRCEECGARFERLVEVGTETAPCSACGSTRTARVYSAQAAPFNLAKTPGEARKQELRNARLRETAKARFKEARARQRAAAAARKRGGAGGGT